MTPSPVAGLVTKSPSLLGDMIDSTPCCPVQPNRRHVTHLDALANRSLNRILSLDWERTREEAVDTQAHSRVRNDLFSNFVAWVRPYFLSRHIIWHFGLVEVDSAVVAIPQGLIALEVFDEEAVCRNIGSH